MPGIDAFGPKIAVDGQASRLSVEYFPYMRLDVLPPTPVVIPRIFFASYSLIVFVFFLMFL